MYFLSGFLNHCDLRFVSFSGCMNKQLPEVLWRHETLLRVTGKWWTICCFCLRSDFWLVVRFWMTPPLFLTLHEPQSHPLGIAYTWSEKGARFDWKEGWRKLCSERESEPLWGVETVSLLVNTLKVLCVGGWLWLCHWLNVLCLSLQYHSVEHGLSSLLSGTLKHLPKKLSHTGE